MNSGLIYKSLRETWLLTLSCGVGVLLFETLIAYVAISYAAEILEAWSSLEIAVKMVSALMGIDADQLVGPQQLIALAWVHPVVLAMLWAHEITFCTRVPAGEIDRGTSDILLGWPVTRWQVLVSETLVWICSGAVLILLATVGNLIGQSLAQTNSPTPFSRLPPLLINFFAMYVAVGGVAWLTSVVTDRRGRAIAVSFAIVVVSFLINFLVPFWEPAEYFAFLGVLHYYQPFRVLEDGTWPLADIATLFGVGLVLWTAALAIFARRNVSTV